MVPGAFVQLLLPESDDSEDPVNVLTQRMVWFQGLSDVF